MQERADCRSRLKEQLYGLRVRVFLKPLNESLPEWRRPFRQSPFFEGLGEMPLRRGRAQPWQDPESAIQVCPRLRQPEPWRPSPIILWGRLALLLSRTFDAKKIFHGVLGVSSNPDKGSSFLGALRWSGNGFSSSIGR